MTSIQIVEHLAREFSCEPQAVRNTLEMIDAGLVAPFIGRVRRAQTGGLSDLQIRRLMRMRTELEELDRRRGTILRMLGAEVEVAAKEPAAAGAEPAPDAAGEGAASEADAKPTTPDPVATLATERPSTKAPREVIERVRTCMDRFELEDLFLPHRRPEPEVQLALDRGLGKLADELVATVPVEQRRPEFQPAPRREGKSAEGDGDDRPQPDAAQGDAPANEPGHGAEASGPMSDASAEGEDAKQTETTGPQAAAAEAPADAAAAADAAADAPAEPQTEQGAEQGSQEPARPKASAPASEAAPSADEEALLHGQIELTPEMARVCAPYVSPDRGVHTEVEALSGAMRILADRLGRDTKLRGTLRRMLRKQGVLTVRPLIEESKLGRHRALLKIRQPLKQVNGNRLVAIWQAQKDRAVQASITLDRKAALPKVQAALGRHAAAAYASMLDAVALRALEHRLLPLLEADVRLELKERGDDEALRFLSQHLRQTLLAPGLGAHPAAGIDVSAKGDWTVAVLDAQGVPSGAPTRIEVAGKDEAALGAELAAALCEEVEGELRPRVRAAGLGHGRGSRAALPKVRAALEAVGVGLTVLIVNEAGLSSYASSELGRKELADFQVPQRMAISLGRRLQDPLSEIVKVDPRHLGLGPEQGLVSKANLRRVLADSVESCTALVGCDVNQAAHALLAVMPGLDAAAARRLIERRAERPFESREELRAEGLLDEVQWTNAAGFLRVRGPERLDSTSLHPEQYELARRLIEASGGSVNDNLGKPGVTKGLRRADFEVEEHTWRDLIRELGWPGRDPRAQLFPPRLLDPNTDRITLTKDRVVEGVVSNVTSFGAFVDLGLEHDGLVHVSEISDRYVRDARELISVGQTVRARILDGAPQRVSLSLKGVASEHRERSGGGRSGGHGRRDDHRSGGGRGGRGARSGRYEEKPGPPVRAAQSRRDGLVGGRKGDRAGGRGGPGGGRGGPGRRGGPGDRRGRDDDFDPKDLKKATAEKVTFNPFASFFKGGEQQPSDAPESKSE